MTAYSKMALGGSSKSGAPVITNGRNYGGLPAGMFLVEPQRTRGGKKRKKKTQATKLAVAPVVGDDRTRPYRYGDFDVLAVSMYPSTNHWDSFLYTVGNWLLPGTGSGEIDEHQPVPLQPNDQWTDDFDQVAKWFRSNPQNTIQHEPDSLAIQLSLI